MERKGPHRLASGNARTFGSAEYAKISIFGFALAALWSSLHSIIIPLRLLDFVAESQKNTYLGLISGVGLVLAIIVQPVAGALSDRSGFKMGRRRPYILIGTILVMLFLPGIGLAGSYIALLVIYCLLQVSSNASQGPYQALIPDLVPEGRRGLASGVKSLLEIAGSVALLRLIGPLMDHYLAGEGSSWLWLSLGAVGLVLLGAMIATILTVKEVPPAASPKPPLLPVLHRSIKVRLNLVPPLISRLLLFIRTHPDFAWFLVSRLLILMAFAILQRFALYFLKDVTGVASPAAVTADLLLVIGAGMLAAVYPAGYLSDKVGRKPIAVSSALFSALGIALLFFWPTYGFVLVAGSILGLSSGAFLSSNWALATDLVAKGEEARYLGLTNLATAGASALVLVLIGPMVDLLNSRSPNLGYSIMLLVCFIFLIFGSLLLLKVRGPGQSR
ncbi:MFS transporter [Chloroflexota bacterium]